MPYIRPRRGSAVRRVELDYALSGNGAMKRRVNIVVKKNGGSVLMSGAGFQEANISSPQSRVQKLVFRFSTMPNSLNTLKPTDRKLKWS
ncbi:hypothetical protein MASR2M79_15740 [Aminivibrio sp.]